MLLAAQALVNGERRTLLFAQGKLRTQNGEEIGSFLGSVAVQVVAGCAGVGERRTEKRWVRFWARWLFRLLLAAQALVNVERRREGLVSGIGGCSGCYWLRRRW